MSQLFSGGGGAIKSIQVGTISMVGVVTATATITAVEMANSIVVMGGSESNDATAGEAWSRGSVQVELTNTTTVTGNRGNANGTTTVAFTIIEFYPGYLKSVQRGKIVVGAGVASNTATITAVDTAKSVVFWGGTDSGGTTGNSAPDRLVLTNTTTVTATRGSAAGAASTVGYQVVEWY